MCRATTPPARATPWACASPPSASCPATKPATDPASPTPPAPHTREPGRLAYGRINTAPYLAEAVASVNRLPQAPHAAVITGDLTDFGRAAEYEHLRALLMPLNMPVYLLPGNHDSREQMRASFPQHHYLGSEGFIQYSVPVGGMQLIALDTVVPGASEGSL